MVVEVDVIPVPPARMETTPGRRRSRASEGVRAALSLAAAVALLFVGLVTLGHAPAVVKVVVVVASLIAAYQACDRGLSAALGHRVDTGLWLSIAWLGLLIGATSFADFLPLGNHDDLTKDVTAAGYARPDLLSAHPLGTNNFGLDLLARSIYGARTSLLTAAFAVVVSAVVGGTIGVVAAYRRRGVDSVVGVFTDSMLAFPALIVLIALAAILGPPKTVTEAVLKEGLALSIIAVPAMIRLSRGNALVVAEKEFVLAARSIGATTRRVVFRELVPNVLMSVVSFGLVLLAVLIVAEGSLAFLGLGLAQPNPTWGNMIAEADISILQEYPFIALVPGAFMLLTVYSFNRIGEHMRARHDRRESKI